MVSDIQELIINSFSCPDVLLRFRCLQDNGEGGSCHPFAGRVLDEKNFASLPELRISVAPTWYNPVSHVTAPFPSSVLRLLYKNTMRWVAEVTEIDFS